MTTVITLVTGTMFLMWLGEQITERGLGNGISMIIFAGIAAGLPNAIGGTLEMARTGAFSIPLVLFLLIGAVAITALVVFVERGQRKISGELRQASGGQQDLRRAEFASAVEAEYGGGDSADLRFQHHLVPGDAGRLVRYRSEHDLAERCSEKLSPGQPIYVMLYAAAIVFFCFFYTALVFSPKETADNLKKSGAFLPGIRPGEQTAQYIEKIMLRLTLVGAVYITLVCLLPEFLMVKWNVPFYFGGTSLLIMVVVTMDFMAQVQTYMMSHQYENLLKKANFKAGLTR